MSLGTLSVKAGYQIDNTQKRIHLYAQVLWSASADTYPVGGPALDSVLLALPEITTNSGVKYTQIQSAIGSGYIYQRIPSTGKMMILQVPPNGSLTTAAPLQQIPSSTNMNGVFNDVIELHATFIRNA
jgi:hypothetical protein